MNCIHSKHSNIARQLIEADVKTFLGAPNVGSTRLNPLGPSVDSTLRLSPPRRTPITSANAVTPQLRIPNRIAFGSSTRPIDSAVSLTSSESSVDFTFTSPSRSRAPLARAVTPQTRSRSNVAFGSRTTPTIPRRGPPPTTRSTMIGYGSLVKAKIECNGNRNEMILRLKAYYPDIDAADVARDVDVILNM